MGQGDTFINAVIGAVLTVVLSFTVFSPILGGAVAGYLQRGTRSGGIRVGAISGLLAAIPFLLLFGVVGGFILTGTMMGPRMGVPAASGVLLVVGLVVAFAWTVGLSALGGYLGVYIATDTDIGR